MSAKIFLLLPCQSLCLLFIFLALLHSLAVYNTTLNTSGKSRHLCLCPDIREKHGQHFISKYDDLMGLL